MKKNNLKDYLEAKYGEKEKENILRKLSSQKTKYVEQGKN
jgi:hypothetical protein